MATTCPPSVPLHLNELLIEAIFPLQRAQAFRDATPNNGTYHAGSNFFDDQMYNSLRSTCAVLDLPRLISKTGDISTVIALALRFRGTQVLQQLSFDFAQVFLNNIDMFHSKDPEKVWTSLVVRKQGSTPRPLWRRWSMLCNLCWKLGGARFFHHISA
jgi:hypothetical protein